jgi:hypothetical protein
MARRVPVTTCPECGGILQSTTPEPLTSSEVEAGDSASDTPRQCLICGYEEAPESTPRVTPSLAR